ncbi:histidine kinase dimerization/phosphoacceptor domain -containing protein [Thermodesulfobacteriota bacterium]
MKDKKFKWIEIELIYVMGISILFGCLFWVIDGLIEFLYFRDNLHYLIAEGPQTYLESILLKISPHGLFVRFSFLAASIIGGLLVSLFIFKRKKAEKALRESEEQFRTIFNSIIDVYYRADLNGNLTMVSPSGAKALGYDSPDEMLGKNIAKEFYYRPEERKNLQVHLEKYGKMLNFQNVLKKKDGTLITTEANSRYVYDNKGKPIAVEGIFRDITARKNVEEQLRKAHHELEKRVLERTEELSKSYKLLEKEVLERKQAEEQIRASLGEKEVLLREIHHRVKNNFEIISSLLDLSSMPKENQEVQNLCKNAQARIHSMALIHTQLYQADRFDQVDMEKHIQELVDHLSEAYLENAKWITTMIEPSEIYLSLNQAIPCALVLNELIANAFKHAFQEQEKGTIYISINNSSNNTIQISVKDDGRGIPEGVDLSNATGLGLKLTRQLIVGQLKGEMRFNIDNGTEFQIEFKKVE